MLSYNTMYAANLVFKYYSKHDVDSQLYVNIKWKMGKLSVLSTHFAKGTKDGWLKLTLWFFINYKKHADFEIVIEEISKVWGSDSWAFTLQGIAFEPVEMVSWRRTNYVWDFSHRFTFYIFCKREKGWMFLHALLITCITYLYTYTISIVYTRKEIKILLTYS